MQLKKIIKYLIFIICIGIIIICILSLYVKLSTKKQILTSSEIKDISDIDCILVLGAGVIDNRPSLMLKDRLETSIDLYNDNISNKIIMSGDHGRANYNEVKVMKEYGIKNEIPSENIFMDHAGFSTYESIYRAKEVFKSKKIVIVSQEYHLYRALYIANKLGLEAYGVPAKKVKYKGQIMRELREILARDKDFVKSIIKPKPTYLGNPIPVSGNGDKTNDFNQIEE